MRTWLELWLVELWNCFFKDRLYGNLRIRRLTRLPARRSHPYNK